MANATATAREIQWLQNDERAVFSGENRQTSLDRAHATPATEWLHNNSNEKATLTHADAEATTVSFSLNITGGLGPSGSAETLFKSFSAQLGFSYATTVTVTDTYSFLLQPGQTARVIYVPRFERIEGWMQRYATPVVDGAMGVSQPYGDPVWSDIYVPKSDGGLFELEFSESVRGAPISARRSALAAEPVAGSATRLVSL